MNTFLFYSSFSLFGMLVFSSLYGTISKWKKYFSKKELTKLERHIFYLPFHRLIFQKQRTSEERRLFVFSLLLGRAFFYFLYFFFSFLLFFSFSPPSSPLLSFRIISWFCLSLFLFLFFSEWLPWFFISYCSRFVLSVFSFFASCLLFLGIPFFLPCTFLFSLLIKNRRSGPAIAEAKEEVLAIIEEINSTNRALDPAEKKMIESVITFSHRIVREVMLPRVDMFFLSCNTTIREAAHALQEKRYSRVPVYKNSVDNVIGVLMYKDLLKAYFEHDEKKTVDLNQPIQTLVKDVLYTPETKKVSRLLQDFCKRQIHLAIVVDEYGGTSGIITIEDVLEEIVGEIEDEDDQEDDGLFIQPLQEKGWLLDAKISILDINKHCHITIPQEGDYDTIGGYISQKLGLIPPSGTTIHLEKFDIEVVRSDNRSIDRVRILPHSLAEDSESE